MALELNSSIMEIRTRASTPREDSTGMGSMCGLQETVMKVSSTKDVNMGGDFGLPMLAKSMKGSINSIRRVEVAGILGEMGVSTRDSSTMTRSKTVII
jgi:hypothetical protein